MSRKTYDFGLGPVTILDSVEYTKDPMTKDDLPENGVFIFGSNKQGHHYGGAARFAHTELGAEWGVGEGLTGRCYAFPTLNFAMTDVREGRADASQVKLTPEDFKESFEKLIITMNEHPEKKFYMTKIGLGIAGYTLFELHKAFWDAGLPFFFSRENFVYPMEFELPDDAFN